MPLAEIVLLEIKSVSTAKIDIEIDCKRKRFFNKTILTYSGRLLLTAKKPQAQKL